MEVLKANTDNLNSIKYLVKDTINRIYPNYYPKAIVDFFLNHHSLSNILKDIKLGSVYILMLNNEIIGTCSHNKNRITRLFISPEKQNQGFGKYLMNYLECILSKEYNSVFLDSSLSASIFYEKLGYKTIKHENIVIKKNFILVYEIMKKTITKINTKINYNNKIFIPMSNSKNGEVGSETTFYYYQNKNILWANYYGGSIIKGFIIGKVNYNGDLDFHYQHVNTNGEIKIGKCISNPTILENNKIQLNENWQWLNGNLSKGTSVLIEK